jgi:hypothetical protein
MSKELTTEEAIAFDGTDEYKNMTLLEKAWFQINQPKLCMPFEKFHEAVEKSLGRPVFTHEFGMSACVDSMKAQLNDMMLTRLELAK